MTAVGILGYGNMGRAFALGLRRGLGEGRVVAYDVNQDRIELAREDGIGVARDLHFLIDSSDIVLIAVKPKDVKSVAPKLKEAENKLLVSIAAGVNLTTLESLLGKKKIIRSMPNINVLVLKGSIAYVPNEEVSTEEEDKFRELFSHCGKLYKIEEGLMDSFTALAGSSPAFILSFIDALAMAGVREGFAYKDALDIVLSTLLGTATLLDELGGNPNEWITKITSPAGTTVEGIKRLEERAFKGAVMECIEAAASKAKGMGK